MRPSSKLFIDPAEKGRLMDEGEASESVKILEIVGE
jgi:hypothetical protein